MFFEDVYWSICVIFQYVVNIYKSHLWKNKHSPLPIIAPLNALLKVFLIFLTRIMVSYNFEIMFSKYIWDLYITFFFFFKILSQVHHSQNMKKLEIRYQNGEKFEKFFHLRKTFSSFNNLYSSIERYRGSKKFRETPILPLITPPPPTSTSLRVFAEWQYWYRFHVFRSCWTRI